MSLERGKRRLSSLVSRTSAWHRAWSAGGCMAYICCFRVECRQSTCFIFLESPMSAFFVPTEIIFRQACRGRARFHPRIAGKKASQAHILSGSGTLRSPLPVFSALPPFSARFERFRLARFRPNLAQGRPTLGDFGRVLSDVGQVWPRGRPHVVNFDRNFGRTTGVATQPQRRRATTRWKLSSGQKFACLLTPTSWPPFPSHVGCPRPPTRSDTRRMGERGRAGAADRIFQVAAVGQSGAQFCVDVAAELSCPLFDEVGRSSAATAASAVSAFLHIFPAPGYAVHVGRGA